MRVSQLVIGLNQRKSIFILSNRLNIQFHILLLPNSFSPMLVKLRHQSQQLPQCSAFRIHSYRAILCLEIVNFVLWTGWNLILLMFRADTLYLNFAFLFAHHNTSGHRSTSAINMSNIILTQNILLCGLRHYAACEWEL